uniref:Pentatricopeptide repeat-containing protein n=1 Tax=Syphacia muris TaxID=451379 RepID=A0A0N5A9Q9_9BILA
MLTNKINLTLAERYTTQVNRGSPSAAATLSYACGLIKSSKSDVRKGISLLEELFRRDSEDVSKRDYVYFLAVAHTRLKVIFLLSIYYFICIFKPLC